jgi:hypothetical protein
MSPYALPRHLATGLMLAALAGGCVSDAASDGATAGAEGRSCFRPEQVNDFTPVDRDTVDVRVGVSRHYRLELGGACSNIDWAQNIVLRSSGGARWICQGLDAEIFVPDVAVPQRCPVLSVRELSETEARAAREAGDESDF